MAKEVNGKSVSNERGEAPFASEERNDPSHVAQRTTPPQQSQNEESIASSSPQQPGLSGDAWRKHFDEVRSLCQPGAAATTGVSHPPLASLLLSPPTSSRASPPQDGETPEQPSPRPSSQVPPRAASWGADQPSSIPDGGKQDPILILSDMNGTLLYRAKQPILLPPGAQTFMAGDPKPLQYCIRPGASDLIGGVSRHPRARFAFYTSMRKVNALPAARFLLPPDCRNEGDPEVYDRPFNAPDPEGANHWDTVRDLPLIWSTPDRTGTGFGPHNTVMIDDTPRKMRHQDAGMVVIPEYTEASVMPACRVTGVGREAGGKDGEQGARAEESAALEEAARAEAEVMPRLAAYLRRLLDESGADVRRFIEQNPFQAHASRAPAEIDFVGAVRSLLASGPLACFRPVDTSEKRDDARRSASTPVVPASSGDDDIVSFVAKGFDWQTAVDFGEFLQEACLAGERWGLNPGEMDRLRAWSGTAKIALQKACP